MQSFWEVSLSKRESSPFTSNHRREEWRNCPVDLYLTWFSLKKTAAIHASPLAIIAVIYASSERRVMVLLYPIKVPEQPRP